jgi:hypothetical protein
MRNLLLRYSLAVALCCISFGCSNAGFSSGQRRILARSLRQRKSWTSNAESEGGSFVAVNLEDAYGYYLDKCQWDQAADRLPGCRMRLAGAAYIGQDRVRLLCIISEISVRAGIQPYAASTSDHGQADGSPPTAGEPLSRQCASQICAVGGRTMKTNTSGERRVEVQVGALLRNPHDFDKGWDKGGAARRLNQGILRSAARRLQDISDVFTLYYKN